MAVSKVASEDEFRFAIGESMLCFYGRFLYEVKCLLRKKTIKGIPVYYIHYKGWKNIWNEWVYSERLLDINEVNVKKMELLKQKELESKKGKRSKTAKTSIKKQDKLSTKTHIGKIDNEYYEQLKNLDVSQTINGTSNIQLNFNNSSTTIVNKENVCNKLPIGEKKEYSEAANSKLIPKGNNSSSESEVRKRGRSSKTLPTRIKKERASIRLLTAQKELRISNIQPAFSNLIPKGNNSSSESKVKKRDQPSKTLPTRIKKKRASNRLLTAQKELCVSNIQPAFSNLIPKGNNSSSESKVKKRGQPSKTLPTRIKKQRASSRLLTAQKELCISNIQPAFSNLIPKGNNSSSESKVKKRSQPSKTLPTRIKKKRASNRLLTAQKELCISNIQPAFSNLIPKGNNSSSESKVKKKGLPSKTFAPRIRKSTRIEKIRQNKSNTPNSKLAEENKGHTLIEETHKRMMPIVNIRTQSVSLEMFENVPSTSQLTENINPIFSRIIIPNIEEPEIIDLTKDEEIDIKPNIVTKKERSKSVIMNIFVNTQNGEVSKHISVEHAK